MRGLVIFFQRDGFNWYRKYGENNEHAQKLLYELEDKPVFKGFFVVRKQLSRACRQG